MMKRTYGRPSTLKDALGVAILAGTAWLYAISAAPQDTQPACAPCEELPTLPATSPAETPAPADAVRSLAQERAGVSGRAGAGHG